MIEVRIRAEYDAKAVHLCMWPATNLDGIIPAIQSWGVTSTSEDFPAEPELTGTFIYSPEGAYFEVLIHDVGSASP